MCYKDNLIPSFSHQTFRQSYFSQLKFITLKNAENGNEKIPKTFDFSTFLIKNKRCTLVCPTDGKILESYIDAVDKFVIELEIDFSLTDHINILLAIRKIIIIFENVG